MKRINIVMIFIFIFCSNVILSDPALYPLKGTANGIVVYNENNSKEKKILDFQGSEAEIGTAAAGRLYHSAITTSGKVRVTIVPEGGGFFRIDFKLGGKNYKEWKIGEYENDNIKGDEITFFKHHEKRMHYFVFRVLKKIKLESSINTDKTFITILPETTLVLIISGEYKYGYEYPE